MSKSDQGRAVFVAFAVAAAKAADSERRKYYCSLASSFANFHDSTGRAGKDLSADANSA
jgi:hypothetical protein